MAAATCTAAGLVTAGACFTEPNFGSKRQKALLAWLWWQTADSALNSITSLANQLTATACIAALTKDQQEAAMIGILNRGYGGIETISLSLEIAALTAATAAEAVKCLQDVSDPILDAMVVYNMCRFFGAAV